MAKKNRSEKDKFGRGLSLIEKGILASRELKTHVPDGSDYKEIMHHANAEIRMANTPREKTRIEIIEKVVDHEIELAKIELENLKND